MQHSDYQCSICNRSYREKFNFDRHVVYCTFLNESRRERNNSAEVESEPIPDTRMMYKWMQEMALKIEKLEKGNDKLRGVVRVQKKNDVEDWIKQNCYSGEKCPSVSFSVWMGTPVLAAIPQHLNTVFQKDLLAGMSDLLVACAVGENLPIRAFTNKVSEFYIYELNKNNENMEWKKMDTKDIFQWFSLIESHFQTAFRDHWVVPNMSKINGSDEQFSQLYVLNYQKILGNGRMTTDTRYQRLRNVLYNTIKQKV